MISASLNNYRQSPRKVRGVANLIRGKAAIEAMHTLKFLSKKATDPLAGLLASALANAKNGFSIEPDGLFVKEIRVDVGAIMKRSMPRARGTAYRINKRTSHILLTLAPIAEKPMKGSKARAAKMGANKAKVAAKK
jgi:large subunit ribosomal protein L22